MSQIYLCDYDRCKRFDTASCERCGADVCTSHGGVFRPIVHGRCTVDTWLCAECKEDLFATFAGWRWIDDAA